MFRFDSVNHEYVSMETGEAYPHITGLLKVAGLVDDRWYTAESRDRGSAVHRLTTDYDLGAFGREDVATINSKYKGWLAAHVKAMDMIRPQWRHIEEPFVHQTHLYGGRPDRVGLVYGAVSLMEIKSGDVEKSHPIQLALQAILVEPEVKLPAETLPRYGLYLKANGKWRVETFVNRKDFDVARRIIRDHVHYGDYRRGEVASR